MSSHAIPITESAASMLRQLASLICRFKEEIEDRIPRYFEANPLRIHWRGDGAVSRVRADVAKTPDPMSTLARLTGVRLQVVSDDQQSNLVDKLFALRAQELLADLHQHSAAASETDAKESAPANHHASRAGLPAEMHDEIPAAHHNGCCSGLDADDWRSSLEKKQLRLPEGIALNYYACGTGSKTVVLLNAYGQNFGYWKKFIQTVSSQARVILWLPRGNDPDTVGLACAGRQADHASDLDRILAHEGIEKCALVAWCSGPKLALEYCFLYPHRVSSMLFVAASFKGLSQHKGLETEYEKNLESLLATVEQFPETADVVLEYLKGSLLAQSKQARSIQDLASISERDLQEALCTVNVSLQDLVLQPFHAANVVAYAKQMREFWKRDFLPFLPKAGVPVLFVGGDCDRIASQAIAKAVAAMMPQASYLEVTGGTHYIQYEQWDLLAQLVEDFVHSGGRLRPTPSWTRLTEPSQQIPV